MLSRSERFLPPHVAGRQAESSHVGRERGWMDGWMSDGEKICGRESDTDKERVVEIILMLSLAVPQPECFALVLPLPSFCGFLNSGSVKMQACILNHIEFYQARQMWTVFIPKCSWRESSPFRMTLLYLEQTLAESPSARIPFAMES